MFWNVRPSPATTMSLGRALRKIPNRRRRRWYQGGRATPVTRTTSRTMTVDEDPEDDGALGRAGDRQQEP